MWAIVARWLWNSTPFQTFSLFYFFCILERERERERDRERESKENKRELKYIVSLVKLKMALL